MVFHKLLARVCQTLKMKIRCFGYGYKTTKLEYRDQTMQVQFGGYDTTSGMLIPGSAHAWIISCARVARAICQ
jgi:hypothetical protein